MILRAGCHFKAGPAGSPLPRLCGLFTILAGSAWFLVMPLVAQQGVGLASTSVFRVPITGVIELGLAPFVERSIEEARVAGADAIVLDIDDRSSPADMAEGAAAHVTAMAARERRDALNALAEDMELMFADKTAR